MKIINPKEHLLVFTLRGSSITDENRMIFNQYGDASSRIHFITHEHILHSFNEVDILFCGEWWRRKDCDDILCFIDTYVFSRRGRIIGDKNCIPDSLWNRYNRKNRKIDDSKIYSRFELLDLR